MPKMPPKKLFTFCATVTLYWYARSPAPAQTVVFPAERAVSRAIERSDRADGVAVVGRDALRLRRRMCGITGERHRARERGGVGGALLAILGDLPVRDVDTERGHAEEDNQCDREPDEHDPAFIASLRPRSFHGQVLVGTGSSWKTESDVIVGEVLLPKNWLKSPGTRRSWSIFTRTITRS